MALTGTAVRNAKPSGKTVKLSDGEGLQLWIAPNGSKLWRLAYRLDRISDVSDDIGKNPANWPLAPKGCLFLVPAFNRIGCRLFGDAWVDDLAATEYRPPCRLILAMQTRPYWVGRNG